MARWRMTTWVAYPMMRPQALSTGTRTSTGSGDRDPDVAHGYTAFFR